MAFIDRLKDAYILVDTEMRKRRVAFYDAETDENLNALEAIEEEQKFIMNQLKPNGFDLEFEASRHVYSIDAVKCEYCGVIFEFVADSVKHVLDKHMLDLLK